MAAPLSTPLTVLFKRGFFDADNAEALVFTVLEAIMTLIPESGYHLTGRSLPAPALES